MASLTLTKQPDARSHSPQPLDPNSSRSSLTLISERRAAEFNCTKGDSKPLPRQWRPSPELYAGRKFSLNTNQASKAVNTASRFNKSEAEDTGVTRSPMSNRIGPKIPPARIALPSQGRSCRFKPASIDLFADMERRNQSQLESPMPDPR